jgi:hypothetical protein
LPKFKSLSVSLLNHLHALNRTIGFIRDPRRIAKADSRMTRTDMSRLDTISDWLDRGRSSNYDSYALAQSCGVSVSAAHVFFCSVTFHSSNAGDKFAYAVAGVDDVNGDTYPDILVGAPYYDNGGRPTPVNFTFIQGPRRG